MKKTLLATAATVSMMAAVDANAATSTRVMFTSGEDRLVGDLYLPDNFERGDKLPAVIVTGAWTTVKEQMPARYAAEMADKGYAALAFDFRNWGQSEGSRRQLEHPEMKTQDIVAAAEFLSTLEGIDPTRIGGLGICASAGYMADAAARSQNIQSLALVAPWLHNADIVDAVYGGQDAVAKLIETSQQSDELFATTGKTSVVPAASKTDETAIMYQAPYYTDKDHGLIPEYVNEFNLSSWEPWLTYDAIAVADKLGETPVAIVHSEAAAIPVGAHTFFGNLQGQKSELWLDDATQFDFYDTDDVVAKSVNAVADHFSKTLK